MVKRISILILMAAMLTGCIMDDVQEKENAVKIGDQIPNFTAFMNNGTTVTGKELSSGVACIMFFHTSCKDCRETLPQMQEVYNAYHPKGVKFAIISREESSATISAFWEEKGLTMPWSAQTDREIYSLFANSIIPRIYISKEGRITALFTDSPTPTAAGINNAIDAL